MRLTLQALFAVILIAAVSSGAVQKSRLKEYGHQMVGGQALARSAGSAAFGQMRNHPPEWGGGAGGYAKRFGSSMGHHIVKGTIQMGVGAWHHEDQHYYRSNRQGTWPRLKYAVGNTFMVHRNNGPGRTPALGRVSGAFGAGLISRAWQPASAAGLGAGFASGGISVGADVGVNVAREFLPRHNKKKVVRRAR
jgi:hypothetical protein